MAEGSRNRGWLAGTTGTGGFARLRVAGRDDVAVGDGGGIHATDGGWPGRGGRVLWGFAELAVAGRDDGGVAPV